MSGKAIVLSGADFSALGLGKVQFSNVDGSIPVTSITTDVDKPSIKVGETATITASVFPLDATNSNVFWGTSSNAIATVSANGKICTVTAIAPGDVVITCTSESNTNIKSLEQMTVTDILLTGLVISGSTEVTNNAKYTVAYTPANTTQTGVIWSSSNTAVATIDSAGNLKVISAGNVTITATSSKNNAVLDTFDVTCLVQVIPVTSIGLSASGNSVNIGNTLAVTATTLPSTASNKTLVWSVNNSKVTIVSSNDEGCVISGVSAGAVTVTATAQDGSGVVGTLDVTVVFVYVTSIAVTPNYDTLRVSSSIVLGAVMSPSNATNKAIVWSKSNSNVDITPNGDQCIVTGVTEGTSVVTATAQDGSGIIGTYNATVLAALQVDNTMIVHLESEDYTPSAESWLCRKSGLSAYVFGNPAKSANGLTFASTARYCRYCLDIASIYHGGSFTLYMEGTFTTFASSSPSNRISGIQHLSGNSSYGIWALTRGATDGLTLGNVGNNYYASGDATVSHRCAIVFDVPEERTTIYGLNGSNVVVEKYKDLTGTVAAYKDPFNAFIAATTFWLSNGYTIGTGTLGSTADATNQHTIKTIKLFNVAKTLAEVTAMLTA